MISIVHIEYAVSLHDCSGMIVFKLERERPAYAAHGGTLYYIKDRYLRSYEFATQRDNPLMTVSPGLRLKLQTALPQLYSFMRVDL
jgi:hypothetical protein